MKDVGGDVTRLLVRWSGGDHSAADELMPVVYNELRRRHGEVFLAKDQTLGREVAIRVLPENQKEPRWSKDQGFKHN